jgi:hypothetical protein
MYLSNRSRDRFSYEQNTNICRPEQVGGEQTRPEDASKDPEDIDSSRLLQRVLTRLHGENALILLYAASILGILRLRAKDFWEGQDPVALRSR